MKGTFLYLDNEKSEHFADIETVPMLNRHSYPAEDGWYIFLHQDGHYSVGKYYSDSGTIECTNGGMDIATTCGWIKVMFEDTDIIQ